MILTGRLRTTMDAEYTRRWDTSHPMNLRSGWRMGINDGRDHLEIGTKSDNKKRGSDQNHIPVRLTYNNNCNQ